MKSTVSAVKVFQAYLEEIGEQKEFEEFNPEKLNSLLTLFYGNARRKSGDFYKKNSFASIRFGLVRYMQQKGMNIIDHPCFQGSNAAYKAALIELKKIGKGAVAHHPEITPQDLKLLYRSFSLLTPEGLQEKVMFDILFYMCRRGRENLRNMTKDTFAIKRDSSGKDYVYQQKDELDKNHRESDEAADGRMYETKQSSCPVRAYKMYIDRLHPEAEFLWQRPKAQVEASTKVWYCNAPLGKNSLEELMPKLSTKYNLSRRYTNHSVRATSVTVLDEGNVEARHIMKISGHKSEASIRSYARRISEQKLCDISNTLTVALEESSQEQSDQEVSIEPTFTLLTEEDLELEDAGQNLESEAQAVSTTSGSNKNQQLVPVPPAGAVTGVVVPNVPSGVMPFPLPTAAPSTSVLSMTSTQSHVHTLPQLAGTMSGCVINLNISYN